MCLQDCSRTCVAVCITLLVPWAQQLITHLAPLISVLTTLPLTGEA